MDGRNVIPDVHAVLRRMENCALKIRSGAWTGSTGARVTDVVNIGIGGSDLGPAMAYQALRGWTTPDIQFHFVSNVDPAHLATTLATLEPATTLFVVVSKTFTTQETMTNAEAAKYWLEESLGRGSVKRHFLAVSTNVDAAGLFGIDQENVFEFWDWVGGRYSLTSAVGLSTMIALGPEHFSSLLQGCHDMDQHFATAPIETNVPITMGLLAVWNRNFLNIPSTAVLPYAQALEQLPAYLQQLVMESNGKRVMRDGSATGYQTSGVVWGSAGTGGQHSFHQLLHQGTQDCAVDFVVVGQPTRVHGAVLPRSFVTDAHNKLVANALAQASVLSLGFSHDEPSAELTPADLSPHKDMPGDRPVTMILIPELSPHSLGALLAAYEHSVFTSGVIWQLNSFDQYGVEFGKQVAGKILDDIQQGVSDDLQLDSATRCTLQWFLREGGNHDADG